MPSFKTIVEHLPSASFYLNSGIAASNVTVNSAVAFWLVSEPLLIHLTLFFSDLTAFSLQLFFTSGFLSWFLRGQVFLNYFRNVNKSCEIFFWVLWEIIFKGMLFIWAAQTLYFFPLLCTTFSCPLLLSFIYGNSVCQQCDMPNLPG